MPTNTGSYETSRLMRDIGNAVDMNWSCSGSGAKMSNATLAFMFNFGYKANFSDFKYSVVEQQLGWGYPVILGGYENKKSCFLWWCSYKDGHAWVCDGYKSSFNCRSGSGYLSFHMNWGWTQYSWLDGWYTFDRWDPGTSNYKYKKEMIYNIKP